MPSTLALLIRQTAASVCLDCWTNRAGVPWPADPYD
jgi:hypothetical protein